MRCHRSIAILCIFCAVILGGCQPRSGGAEAPAPSSSAVSTADKDAPSSAAAAETPAAPSSQDAASPAASQPPADTAPLGSPENPIAYKPQDPAPSVPAPLGSPENPIAHEPQDPAPSASAPLGSPENPIAYEPQDPGPSASAPLGSAKNPIAEEPQDTGAGLPAPADDYIKITRFLDGEGNKEAKIITDPETVRVIRGYFTGLTESGVSLAPNTGGRYFLVGIPNGSGGSQYYRLARDRDGDGKLYCKYNESDPASNTGWLLMPDAGAYSYLAGLFGF